MPISGAQYNSYEKKEKKMPKKSVNKSKPKYGDAVPQLIYVTVSHDEDDDDEDGTPMLFANRSLRGMVDGTRVYVYELKEANVVDVVPTLRAQKPVAVRKP